MAVLDHEPPGAAGDHRTHRGRRIVVVVVVVGMVLVGGGAFWAYSAAADGGAASEHAQRFEGVTEEIVRGDLQGSTTVSGTLRFASPHTIRAGRGGTVTALPSPGTVVTPGNSLYSVDNIPVLLLRGDLPAWRELSSGVDGPDVRQLQENLNALGYPVDVDGKFRWRTREAVKNWQKANGLESDGVLPFGSIVFSSGDIRIGNITASVGDQVAPGGALFEGTSTSQIVDANIKLADQQLASLDAPVTVRLPGGAEMTGKITGVGTPTEVDGANNQKQTVIPIVITLDDPAAAASFQQASVSVDIPSERREDVLSVPVGALIALSPESFGVEIVEPDGTTRQVPVTTGLFAGGRVEISGDEITAGQKVVVPKR
jgi:peptidoglycan hydrolase-like protein with peptidoglycan-binding domain